MADNNKAIHKEAMKRWNIVNNKEKDQRKLAIEECLFIDAPDGQWDKEAKAVRDGKPRYTIDRVGGAIDQLVGDQRQNRTQIKVEPVGGGADEDLAEIYSGLIRNIEMQSKAANAYDAAYDETLKGGYGGFRVLTEYNDDDVFEQDLKIKWIPSAASSLWLDPSSNEYDKRDAMWGFLITNMTVDEHKDKFPNATITDFEAMVKNDSTCSDWVDGDNVRVAEYWVKTPIIKNIALMTDKSVIDLDEEKAALDELKAKDIVIATGLNGKPMVRKVKSHKVEMHKMNGGEILEGPHAWAGKFIPLIPVFGKTSVVEGKTFVRGIVRKAKDAQRIYNYTTSAAVETTALTPKDPIWMTRAQAAGHEPELQAWPRKNQPIMFYNHDPDAPGMPQRGGAPAVQTALISQQQQAGLDVEYTTGIFAPALGNAPQLLSEKSVQSQAEKGDRGAFVISDNLNKSIQYVGDILVDLLPRIVDTPRLVRILGIDGKSEEIEVNKETDNEAEFDKFNQSITDRQTGDKVIVNDLSRGKYSTSVETGPAYNTLKQETLDKLIDIGDKYPQLGELGMDIIAQNLNILGADELIKRVRKQMITNGIAEPTEEEIKELGLDQPQEPDPGQVALTDNVLMQNAKLEADITLTDEKVDSETLTQYEKATKAYETLIDTFTKQQTLGIPLGEVEQTAINDALALIELARDKVQV